MVVSGGVVTPGVVVNSTRTHFMRNLYIIILTLFSHVSVCMQCAKAEAQFYVRENNR